MRPTRRAAAAIAMAIALPVGLAACASAGADGGGLDLARAGCPTDVRIRTADLPRVEQGALYRLLGDDFRIDADGLSVTGDLVVNGDPTGVRLTIISSNEHAGVSGAQALWTDDDLLLAAVDADDALVDIQRFPTVGVFAPLERDPAIVFWDPAVYDARSIAVLGASFDAAGLRVTVRGGASDRSLDYLVGSRLLVPDQLERESDGRVDAFVAASGQIAQVGDVTIEPYLLANSPEWDRPLEYQLLDDAGYPRYRGVLSVRPDRLALYSDCLTALVPILQQSTVDYVRDPDTTTGVIVRLAEWFGEPGYTTELADQALQILLARGMLGNGGNDTIGDIDASRLQRLINQATPAFRVTGTTVPQGTTASDLVTNAFIDPAIGL